MKILLIILLFNTTISSAFVTVGSDASCTYNSSLLGSAILSNDEVRITNQQFYSAIKIINKNANIIGGYNNCTDAQNNIVSETASVMFGNDDETLVVIKTTASGGHIHRLVSIANLEIVAGKNVTVAPNVTTGGGIDIIGNVEVNLVNIEIRDSSSEFGGGGIFISGLNGAVVNLTEMNIHDNAAINNREGGGLLIADGAIVAISDSIIDSNTARNGAGLKIIGGNSTVNIFDTQISNNSAEFSGGGIDCGGQNNITIRGNSSIDNNTSLSSGGGIYLSFSCHLTSFSGDTHELEDVQYGIHHNTTTNFGGGAYVTYGARLDLIGNSQHYANLTSNQTMSNFSTGGGVYATKEGSYVRGINSRISGNSANRGAAILAREMAKIHLRRSSGRCFGNQICSEISENTSSFSGNIRTESCGTVDINQTTIHDNTALIYVVASLEGNTNDSCHSVLEGNIIYNNHKVDNTPTSMISLDRKHELDFAFNTVTDNNASSIFNMLNDSNTSQILNINASLIWNSPASTIISFSNVNTYSGNCFAVTDSGFLPVGFGNYIMENVPAFTNALNHDYSRTQVSPYSDNCNTDNYTPRFHDIVGTVRGHEWIPIVQGPYDVGAYEYDDVHTNNVIFQDGLE